MYTFNISINAWMIASREIFHISVEGLDLEQNPEISVQYRVGKVEKTEENNSSGRKSSDDTTEINARDQHIPVVTCR
jgi:hypothetical protein